MSINNDGEYVPADESAEGTNPSATPQVPSGQTAAGQTVPIQYAQGAYDPNSPYQYPQGQNPYAQGPYGQGPTEPPKKSRSPWIAVAIATAAVVCIGGLGTAAVAELTSSHSSSSSSTQNGNSALGLGNGTNGTFGNGGRGTYGQFGSGGQSIGQQATAGETPATPATAAQEVGVVTINTDLDYDSQEEAAGSGMILTSNGYILTNNHVIDGASDITVTVASTGKTYKATVVGSDTTADVAVLKLTGASGLSTVSFAPSENVTVGEAIHSVGNAEGTGHLVTATGVVGAVNQTLTIGSDDSSTTETLSGMIQVQSDVVSGDSGGPLFDSSGKVIGMITAASSGSTPVTGDAINIKQVLKVADEIQDGVASSDIQYGTPSFLGVDLSDQTSASGVIVESAIAGEPAASAGIGAGDVITSVNGVAVTTPTGLSTDIRSFKVGTQVTIAWLDASGVSHSALVTLVAGPAS